MVGAPPVQVGDDAAPAARRVVQRALEWAPVAIVIACLIALAARRTMHLANADALLPSLMSTQNLTWFYWGQDRLANVVPALAWPVRSVRWNLAVQFTIVGCGWFGLVATASANHLSGIETRGRVVVVAATTGVTGLLTFVLLRPFTLHVLVFEQLYALALLMFIGGLVTVSHARLASRSAGAALVLAATMINPSLALYTPIALVLPGVSLRRWQQIVWPITTAAAALLLTNAASQQFGTKPRTGVGYDQFSLTHMRANFDDALSNVLASVQGWWCVGALLIVIAWLAARWRAIDWRLRATYLGAPAFAVVWTFVFSGNAWVEQNGGYARYFFPVYAAALLLLGAAITDVTALMVRRLDEIGRVPAAWRNVPVIAPVSLAALAATGAVWSITRIRIDVLAASQPTVTAAQKHSADFVVGGYWETWPAVIEARAEGLDVFGVALRDDPTREAIAARIDHDAQALDPVIAVCLMPDASECVQSIDDIAGEPIDLVEILAMGPLVIEVTASPHPSG